jgi:actin-related protein
VHVDNRDPGDVEGEEPWRETMASNIASSVRPSLRQATQPSSPQTPNRFISSSFSSPGSGFRQTEDAIIIELGSRYLRAGFEGEFAPQCVLTFGPEDSRRVGDYRGWAPAGRKREIDIEKWGQDHELWRMDLTSVDLGLVEDKIERAVREAYTKYLLTDVGSARLILVLPSMLPHPLLSTVITTLFNRWKYSSIALLPSPTMAAVGAGVRSAFVVDIGWSETIVTAVYEYREIRTKRSTRSMQSLLKELGRTLNSHQQGKDEDKLLADFELAEELMARMVWCKPGRAEAVDRGVSQNGLKAQADPAAPENIDDQDLEIDWPTHSSSELVKLPSTLFSEPVEKALLVSETQSPFLDDHEHSLPMLVYESLQGLPPDARAICMSRIVFVGGGSDIPGLARRILFEVDALVKKNGWSAVRGEKEYGRREGLRDIGQGRAKKPNARFKEPLPPGQDFVEEKLQKQQAKEALPFVQGELRQVESLGAWVGASLVASMKIKSFVEIEREKFLQHGLAGAHGDADVSVVPQRTGPGAGVLRSAGDRTSWTLAGWG